MYKISNKEILSRVLIDIIINNINTMISESDLIDNYYNHVINWNDFRFGKRDTLHLTLMYSKDKII